MGLTWGLLWLSGKNMGETARLWILFLPWLAYAAAPLIQHWSQSRGTPPARHNWRWIALLFAAQLITCIGTATRIDGFHFAELQTPAEPADH